MERERRAIESIDERDKIILGLTIAAEREIKNRSEEGYRAIKEVINKLDYFPDYTKRELDEKAEEAEIR